VTKKPTYEELEYKVKKLEKEIVECKQAKEALRHNLEMHQTVVENVDVGLTVVGTDYKIIWVNNTISKWFDKDPSEFVGKHCYKEFEQKNSICHYCPAVKAIATGQPNEAETQGIKPDGTPFTVRDKVYPIIKDGEVIAFNEIVEDITDCKRAENALKASEKNYRAIFESVNDAIIIHDAQTGRPLEINPKMEELLGYSREELAQMKVSDWTVGDPTIMQKEAMRTIKEAALGKPQLLEWHVKRKDSKLIWVEVNLKSAVIRGQKCVLAVVRDITERKLTEEERIRLATAIEHASESVIIATRPGMIQYINPSFERLSGYTQEEIVGQNFRILKSDRHDENFYKDMWDIISKGNVWAGRITNRMKDGTLREFETGISPVRDSSGEIINFVSVNRDVTQEVALAAKLQRAQKMEALGLLAGGVAHDLNNVLSGIVSYPELILEGLPEDSKLKKPIETMQESGHRAAAIVEDLLTVARGVATTKEPLNLNDLIGEYLNSPEFKKLEQFHPSVTIKTNFDSDLFNVNGSHVHIRKVVMNLVSNASEAIEDRGNVTISTMNRYVDRPLKGYDDVTIGEYAVLSVSDDGLGISSVDLERIFEPFYTKKVVGRSGTGLGLAVVWNVVQDHKGYINVANDENGTTFELYFPITREEISGKDLAIPIEDFKGDGETILVVDDVESQRKIACKMLNTLGYKAKAVSSGEEAVEYLTEHTVDLVLLDMIMDPGINGRETYERIIKLHPNQKAVVASGFAETDDVREAQRLGAGQYIKKPITLDKMGIAVRDELKK